MHPVELTTVTQSVYTLDLLRQEAEACLARGQVQKRQPIATLRRYLPSREWEHFAVVLEESGLVLRDRLCDLLPQNTWKND